MKKYIVFLLSVILCGCTVLPKSVVVEQYEPTAEEQTVWNGLKEKGIDKVIFSKRYTYDSNHYYTEFLNSRWMPGGNIYTLSLSDGNVTELVPSLNGGVFGKFDISADASKVVFAYKSAKDIGYRVYEVDVDGNNLRQLTVSPDDEAQIIERYAIAGYHHGTEDLDPCYLPDGGIVFVSTRCHYGILCDGPDIFPTTTLYRMDADGGNITKLSNNSVSENTPAVMNDGRIMYTRWEYVDKGAVAVKCLWAMMPDGSGSVEIYGNDIDFPTTMIMGRPIPGSANEFVFTGTPHCPQNCVGTVVRIDMTKNIRTKEPMTYMTPYVDIREEPGFHFKNENGEWVKDQDGHGPLFRETYPLSRSEFMVSHKLSGPVHTDSAAYDLYMLNENGSVKRIYKDDFISCFNPMPLVARVVPPVIPSKLDPVLAKESAAELIITDVYKGLTGVEHGAVKYIRVLEQVPRPWGARTNYQGEEYDQQHVVITKDTHLGLKIQHGVVKVEDDGSARFKVPAERNIILQVLDSNFMALQTERTFVNYASGEVRSCIGCHETQNNTPDAALNAVAIAMKRNADYPKAQPGDTDGRRTLSYARDVQPVWDRNCVACHSGDSPKGGINLSGNMTDQFNVSYETLVPERRKGFRDLGLMGLVIGENHPKTGNIHYLPPKSLGSYNSPLVAMISGGKIRMSDAVQQKRVDRFISSHPKVELSNEDLLKVTNWIDTNGQYYGSYYGKRNIKYKDEPDFRTEYSFDDALKPEKP